MLSFPHTGKDSWLEQGLYMLAFHATCLVVLLPWFIAMIGLNWAGLCGWRWRLLSVILTLGIMAATVCVPEILLRYIRQ
jgi:type IV secretory pathway VirB2 component (pilin)